MYYIVESTKSVEQATKDLEKAVSDHNFGVLHIHHLGETLKAKGVEFSEECHVLEICNPVQAAKVMQVDMRLNMALPCRISVYSEDGKTKIGMVKPANMLAALSEKNELLTIASEVETQLVKMIEAAK